ncbi:serine protease AprX [Chryseomicrobium aureum]|uniref:S8 family serine peptidase n=1 Tax=Chryseomicrobium aureum TaxID=1441723 RepID=UPI001956715C|nr:S8 family serine peptidase [Chryseomicrobium aureum]MBM7706783.1 serine protease AprX [Chryseomicrobium aureum]
MKRRNGIISALLATSMLLAATVSAEVNVESGIPHGAVIDPELQETFAKGASFAEVIVTFEDEVLHDRSEILQELGVDAGIHLKSLPMTGLVATAELVNQLAKHPDVESIYENRALAYETADATQMTGVDALRTDAALTKANGGFPITGKGIGVVINDSGVDGTHKDHAFGDHLVQNVLGSTNLHAVSQLLPISYVENVPNTDSNSGHGTHVAGIVGGTGAMSSGKYEGAAPGAKLIGYGSGAGVAMLDTLGGFDYALTHQREYNIRVITNSWGDTSQAGRAFDPADPINVATKKLYDRGIITVFSAGNSGPTAGTISGNYKKAPWVITVAAGDKSYQLTDFSSRGQAGVGDTVTVDGETWKWEDRPTVTAPGSKIVSTRVISPLPLLGVNSDATDIDPAHIPFYTTMSGTSMAAPHVAGIVALMLEADPTLTGLEIKEILETTAKPMEGYEKWEAGAGYVDAYRAVKHVMNSKSN